MDKLPSELLPLIIQHIKHLHLKSLFQCSLVSKSFYTVTTPYLWETYIENTRPPLKLITCLQNPDHPLARHLRRVELWNQWDDFIFPILMPHLSLLEELKLWHGRSISSIFIQLIPQHCPRLRALRLWYTQLTREMMDALGQHCPNLEQLDLICCPDASTNLFSPLAHLLHLKKLSISTSLDNGGHWDKATLTNMMTHLPQLTHVNVKFGTSELMNRFVTLAAACASPKMVWPHLTHLFLDGSLCYLGDDQLIPLLLPSRPLLQHLSLTGNTHQTDATLNAITTTSLPKLHTLTLASDQHISTNGIRRLVHRCPQLMLLELHNCHFTTIEFPEAEQDCLEDDTDEDGYYWVKCLKKQTLNKIRHASDSVDLHH